MHTLKTNLEEEQQRQSDVYQDQLTEKDKIIQVKEKELNQVQEQYNTLQQEYNFVKQSLRSVEV